MDRQGRPVTRFKERISNLVADLSAASDIIEIPTPALAETLVRSGPNRALYMKTLGDSWKFQIVPFDSRAAIEVAELVAVIKTNQEKWDTWAKVKFDIQIVAIAKAESADIIYSDDKDIENLAKRLNIRVIRICDLPLPPDKKDEPLSSTSVGPQIGMFDKLLESVIPFPEPESTERPGLIIPELVPVEDDGAVRASTEVSASEPQCCECGCGEFPKLPTSFSSRARFEESLQR